MASNHAYDPSAAFLDDAEAAVTEYTDDFLRMPFIVEGSDWWGPWARKRPGAKLKTRFTFPLHSPEVAEFRGNPAFATLGKRFVTIARKKYFVGVQAEAEHIAEADFEAFSLAPATLAKVVAKHPAKLIRTLLNAGGASASLDWTGTPFFKANTGTLKPVMPGKPALGTWYNAFANAALTPANIKIAIENLQSRKGFDGEPLELEGTHLWLPTEMKESGKNLVEVMQLVPTTLDSIDGGGNTNYIFGRLKSHWVPGMRSDMWIVANTPPDPSMAPFGYVSGGAGSQTEAAAPLSGRAPPYLEPIMHLRDSEMYKTRGKLATGMIIRHGAGLLTSHCLCANYTGAIS